MPARLSGERQARTRRQRGPSVAVRGKPSGYTDRPADTKPVRYAFVDPATQRSTAPQGDTRWDREETARLAEVYAAHQRGRPPWRPSAAHTFELLLPAHERAEFGLGPSIALAQDSDVGAHDLAAEINARPPRRPATGNPTRRAGNASASGRGTAVTPQRIADTGHREGVTSLATLCNQPPSRASAQCRRSVRK